VVRRWPRFLPKPPIAETQPHNLPTGVHDEIEVVAIGASAGGPLVLQAILSKISQDFAAPVLIVQHMARGFLTGMVGWLNETSGIPVSIASAGETALPGHAYFAPDGFHMGIEHGGILFLEKGAREQGARPSVSYLFRSVAKVYGRKAVGILLSGMGSDGADAMQLLKEKGAVTIAQDKESSVVYGMPAAAIALGAAMYVLSPKQIPAALTDLTKRQKQA
jgi:two-component system, chemotaxis family, protein-glutamate methylesterase/glutaminase